MTPKEKAKDLINKYIKPTIKWNPINDVGYYNDINAAKQCALIAVDEILKTNPYEWDGEDLNSNIDYWQEVKQEIEAL
jgi:hypothetical protein